LFMHSSKSDIKAFAESEIFEDFHLLPAQNFPLPIFAG
jgi:hypothetical protein